MRGRFFTAGVLAAGSVVSAAGTQPFTVVVLPDTQYYAQNSARNELYFKGQTNWIVNNRASHNIAFMMHLGDIQNDGNPYRARADDPYQPDFTRPTGLVPDDRQFVNADASLDILDAANFPYSLVAGNHDYLDNAPIENKIEPIYFLKYFGPQRFAGKPWFLGGSPEVPSTTPGAPPASLAGMNMAFLFDAGGRKYLNIGLQFAPERYDLAWAQSVINANPGVPTIVTTHAMLNTTGYQSGRRNIYDELVKNNPQVIMTLNGHINGTNLRTETNTAGLPVHEMLVDYQSTDFPPFFDGAAYMRLMEFDTDNSIVRVKSFSPVTGQFLTDPGNQFDLAIDFDGRFGRLDSRGVIKQATFRHGENGYAGTRDTYVDAGAPTSTAGSTNTGIWVDGDADDTTGGSQPRHGLLRFEGIFGDAAGQIPDDATIVSAKLTLVTSTTTDSHSNSSMALYRMLAPWDNSSTWNSLVSGVAINGAEAILAANATFVPSVNGGTLEFDVTESIYAWLRGAPNYGWAFLPGGTDGWRFNSAENGTVALRPLLTVTYAIPEPGGMGIGIAAGVWAGLRRGRRAG